MKFEDNINKLVSEPKSDHIDKKLKISVVIPAYEEGRLIESALLSFTDSLKEKYKLEVIVSDGGSTDDTVSIARKLSDKLICHTENRRQTIAEGRNMGAWASESDILVFVNADTRIKDNELFFQTISDWAAGKSKYSKYDALACTIRGFPEEEVFKDKVFYFIHNRYVRLLNFIGMGMGRGECQIIKKDLFLKLGGYKGYIAAGEDFDLYQRASKYTRIGFVKELIVFESLRRYRKMGYIRIIWTWTVNALAVMIKNKSVSQDWDAVR